MSTADALSKLLKEIRACRICESHLPLGANPILSAGCGARIMIVGQAPGTRVHQTGIPWNDPSGDTLRGWLQLDRNTFYDADRIAIVPMGFCYPGKGPSGDLPPRAECAHQWRQRLHQQLPNIKLTLLIGQYAQRYYLGDTAMKSVTETVRAWRDYAPRYVPIPHPSPRNRRWLKKNSWFEAEHVPRLRQSIHALL